MGERTTVVWFQAAGCTGCSISLLNADYPSIKNLLLDEVVPGKALALRFHLTLMGPTGQPALEVLRKIPLEAAGDYILIVEGAVPTGDQNFGQVGELSMAQHLLALVEKAQAVVAMGTCAAFGGIPAASPNPTRAMGVQEFLHKENRDLPVVNVPGCPPHPRWLLETLVHLLAGPVPGPKDLDELGRLKSVYSRLIHEGCPRRADFDVGRFAQAFGEEGCLYELGCKGPYTWALCPYHAWNGGVNWCIKAGHPCIGCTEPEFPDFPAPIFRKVTEPAYRRTK